MFERNVTDLVRGLRANKKNEQAFINQCLQEIREEIRSNEPAKKTNAVQKLTYVWIWILRHQLSSEFNS